MSYTPDVAKTVGQFTYDPATKQVSGPASFMKSAAYAAWQVKLESGKDTWVNFAVGGIQPGLAVQFAPVTGPGSDFVTAMLVSLQTCYAGWKGAQSMFGS